MADPWADIGVPVTPTAKVGPAPTPSTKDPWSGVGTPAAKYPSTQEFAAVADRAFGAGRWTDTGDYRTVHREAELMAQGAATVAPGHVSDHSRGTHQAPGAHDITVPGMTPAEVQNALHKAGWRGRVLYEGRAGTQGPHFHVKAPDVTGWEGVGVPVKAADPWAGVGTPVKPAPAKAKPVAAKPQSSKPSGLGDQIVHGLGDAMKADWNTIQTKSAQHHKEADASLRQAGEDINPANAGDPITYAKNLGMAGLEGVSGAWGHLVAPVQAAVDIFGKPVSQATGGRLDEDALGNASSMVGGFMVPGTEPGAVGGLAKDVGGAMDSVARRNAEKYLHLGGREKPTPRGGAVAQGTARDPSAPIKMDDPIGHEDGYGPEAPPSDTALATRAASRAARAEQNRQKRNPNVASPDRVRALQAQHPSPVTHPAMIDTATEFKVPEHPEAANTETPTAETRPHFESTNLWQATQQDLIKMRDEKLLSDEQKMLEAFGSQERVTRFNQLDRMQNSMDPKRADEGIRLFGKEFGKLTPRQERLVYGIGETDAQVHDLDEMIRAHSDVSEGVSEKDSDDQVAYAAALGLRGASVEDLAKVPDGGGSVSAQASYTRISNAYQELARRGVSVDEIPERMVKALVNRGGWRPEQAAEIVGNFVERMVGHAKETRVPKMVALPNMADIKPEVDPVDKFFADETGALKAPEGWFGHKDGPGPGDTPEPMSEEHHGPVVGNEADTNTRLDNALYRLGGASTADKLEAQEFLKGVPKELSDPSLQARLADEIEQQIVDPNHQIPDDLQPAYQVYTKWRDEVRDTVNRLRARGDEDLDPFLPETGYTPRRVVGHTPGFDTHDGPNLDRSQMPPAKRNLSPNTASLKARTAGWMVDDGSGQLHFTQEKPGEGVSHRIATMGEIEANTDIRYYKNPLVNTIDEALRLRRVERNIQVLDSIKMDMKDKGLAFHYEWKRPGQEFKGLDESGQPILGDTHIPAGPGEYNIPDGFAPVKNIPQLKGWAFHPEIAEVLRDYYPEHGDSVEEWLGGLNRALIGSLFITPIPHILNVGAHAVVGRGWDWLDVPSTLKGMGIDVPGAGKGDVLAIPKAYLRGFTTGLEATHEVWTKGPKYRQLLREGAGFMYGDTQIRNFLNVMLEKAGQEIINDPTKFDEFSKQFGLAGLGIKNAKDFTKFMYNASNKSMWAANDMLLMQRILELEKKGLNTREAIFQAEKDIPNYRIPSRVMESRKMAGFMKSRTFLVFGRYKYGQWKALAGMVEDLVGHDATAEERLDAVGKFLVMGFVMAGVAPVADSALQAMTGNKDARVRRAGPFAILDAMMQMSSGDKDVPMAMASMFSVSPAVDYGTELKNNRDVFGRKVIQASTPLALGVQALEFASNPIYPLKAAEDMLKTGGVPRTVGRMFGLDIPPEGTRAKQQQYAKKDMEGAKWRDKHDPLYQKLVQHGVPTGGEFQPGHDLPAQEPESGSTGQSLGPIN